MQFHERQIVDADTGEVDGPLPGEAAAGERDGVAARRRQVIAGLLRDAPATLTGNDFVIDGGAQHLTAAGVLRAGSRGLLGLVGSSRWKPHHRRSRTIEEVESFR
ncbi:hypothetical protein [Agromyces archimandritae]|uniref:Uncharacterized protein n=1 Tax=Agromyces archimandritae TaxID=2781962 RepID=A0A975IPV0_9MICO|nr:hypothetical protein [Agromyces archimandritae]QTX05674.1 hypothetical protein G127AT_05570 [Agromyces archimandritae]